MSDYQPLDLSSLCNAGREAIPNADTVVAGSLRLRGLPFQVGPENTSDVGKFLIALDRGDSSVLIPVNASARRVIFAHRLLESDLLEGGELGKEVAACRD